MKSWQLSFHTHMIISFRSGNHRLLIFNLPDLTPCSSRFKTYLIHTPWIPSLLSSPFPFLCLVLFSFFSLSLVLFLFHSKLIRPPGVGLVGMVTVLTLRHYCTVSYFTCKFIDHMVLRLAAFNFMFEHFRSFALCSVFPEFQDTPDCDVCLLDVTWFLSWNL